MIKEFSVYDKKSRYDTVLLFLDYDVFFMHEYVIYLFHAGVWDILSIFITKGMIVGLLSQ